MMLRIVVAPDARRDIREAHDWYEAEQPGLGERFEAALRACIARICKNPHAFPLVTRHVRRARVRHFPYLLFYQVAHDCIVVVGVFHVSRNPALWMERLEEHE